MEGRACESGPGVYEMTPGRVFQFLTLLALWGLFLGYEYGSTISMPLEWIGEAQEALMSEIKSRGNQWIIYVFLLAYLVAFIWLPIWRRRAQGRGVTTDLLLRRLLHSLFAILVSAQYWRCYDTAFGPLDALVLMSGMLAGVVVRFASAESTGGLSSPRFVGAVLGSLLLFLTVVCLWQPEHASTFAYRGRERWAGLWLNPNRYGMLMGVGFVIATARLIRLSADRSNGGKRVGGTRVYFAAHALAAGVTGFGVYQSFSRGAWLGTLMGVVYLVWKLVMRKPSRGGAQPDGSDSAGSALSSGVWIARRHAGTALLCLTALVVIIFWSFRHSEIRPLRRALSAANMNDFSWRNRVAAYEGSLQMMAERPLVGVGWGLPRQVYGQYYAKPRLPETAAITLNDVLSIGVTMGLPALALFVALIWLALRRGAMPSKAESGDPLCNAVGSRAALIVLVIGFWFGNGLLYMAIGAPFWILLQLSEGGARGIAEFEPERKPEERRANA